MSYRPPFTITNQILNLATGISELMGRKFSLTQQAINLKLRRVNQIKTICGSLAIEGNTLSETQITALLNGEPVVAPAREVQEARNALAVYEQIEQLDPLSEQDLLKAHGELMFGLIDELGQYRSSGVGVMSGRGGSDSYGAACQACA